MSLALSTMFAQQDRFDDGASFARFAAAAGYEGIEISHSTRLEKLEQIISSAILPIVSVHQPAPYTKLVTGHGNSRLNLASLDEDERKAAVEYAAASIAWAAKVGADRVVVHLGRLDDDGEMFDEELQMRRLFDSGRADSEQFAEFRERAVARRAAAAEPHVEAARRSLLELVREGERDRVAVGLENRYHYHEIPLVDEYEPLLDGLVPEQAGYWHDTGHAEVLHRLGFVDRHAWLDRWSGQCIGAHLHDVLGIGDHRSPGDGDVDWSYIVAGVRHLGRYTLEINQHQPDDRVLASRPFLASLGLG